jgi:hypothetical protein
MSNRVTDQNRASTTKDDPNMRRATAANPAAWIITVSANKTQAKRILKSMVHKR